MEIGQMAAAIINDQKVSLKAEMRQFETRFLDVMLKREAEIKHLDGLVRRLQNDLDESEKQRLVASSSPPIVPVRSEPGVTHQINRLDAMIAKFHDKLDELEDRHGSWLRSNQDKINELARQ